MRLQVPYFFTNAAFLPPGRPPMPGNFNFRCVLEEGLYQVSCAVGDLGDHLRQFASRQLRCIAKGKTEPCRWSGVPALPLPLLPSVFLLS